MASSAYRKASRLLSDADLAFVAEASPAPLPGREKLREFLATDEAYRRQVLGDGNVFRRVTAMDEAIVRVSPRLLFEVLLRQALGELARVGHVIERSGSDRVPVFLNDSAEAVSSPEVLGYLAEMLASFTRVSSYTTRVRVRRGTWRRVRHSDLDVGSLVQLAHDAEAEHRMPLYKRAADACLFIVGMFPDFPATATRYLGTGALRSRMGRLSTEEYETLGSRMYRLAADHPAAADAGLAGAMDRLSARMIEARRPLNHIAEHYLRFKRQTLFGTG